jgi:pullulanase
MGLLNGLVDAPNSVNVGRDRAAAIARAVDLAKVGLAGTLATFPMPVSDGTTKALADIEYAGQPAGYVQSPGEVVNYVENHDNLTLFDVNAFRLPRGTSELDRARAQVLGVASVLFSQGIPYLHAGIEILRSKSLDRDSFDSGDWFNRLDWTYAANGFGAGLPPAHRNRDDWPVMQPVLADRTIAPSSSAIRMTRDAVHDLLQIRASSSLFRLRTAEDVMRRLRFRNTGRSQVPGVVVGHLDGAGLDGAGFPELLYVLNFASAEQTVTVSEDAGKPWELHPVHHARASQGLGAARARIDRASGRLTVPGRTAVVFVVREQR